MYAQHNRGRGHGREGRGHGNNNEEKGQNWRGRGRGRSNRSNIECYNCGKYGHYAKECYAKKRVEESPNLVEEDETKEEGILMMTNEGVTLDSDMIWYLDTCASNHMCGHKHLFLDIQEIEDSHVSFGDSTKVPIIGRGKICFSQKDGKEGTMEDVYYVPDLKNNMLSMGQLLEKGYSIFMKDRILHLKDKNESVLANVEMSKNRMFKLNLKSTLSEKSFCDEKIELEVLRAKSSSLEELCNLLTNEKHNLLNERSVIVSQLESAEAKFGNLERRFTKLEEKYVDMEKEKESRFNQVEELHLLLLAQKEKVNEFLSKLEAPYKFSNSLENSVFDLGEEPKWNGVDPLSEKDIWSNDYVLGSLRSKSFLNLFNSKGESREDFVWEIKGNSIQNSAWVGAVKKTEVASNP